MRITKIRIKLVCSINRHLSLVEAVLHANVIARLKIRERESVG